MSCSPHIQVLQLTRRLGQHGYAGKQHAGVTGQHPQAGQHGCGRGRQPRHARVALCGGGSGGGPGTRAGGRVGGRVSGQVWVDALGGMGWCPLPYTVGGWMLAAPPHPNTAPAGLSLSLWQGPPQLAASCPGMSGSGPAPAGCAAAPAPPCSGRRSSRRRSMSSLQHATHRNAAKSLARLGAMAHDPPSPPRTPGTRTLSHLSAACVAALLPIAPN